MLGALGRRRFSSGAIERRKLRGEALDCGLTTGFFSVSFAFLDSLSRGFNTGTATLSDVRFSTLRDATVWRSIGAAVVDDAGNLPGALDQSCEAYQSPAASVARIIKTAVIAPGPNLVAEATIDIFIIARSLFSGRVPNSAVFILIEVISAIELSFARPMRRSASLNSDALANRSSDLCAIALHKIAAI